MHKICAGIILYNPDLQRLSECVGAISPQVSKIIFIDNGSGNHARIYDSYNDPNKYIWINNNSNLGIAKALNQIIQRTGDLGFEWVLTLDQDSVCCPDIIGLFSSYTANHPETGVISPYVIDINITGLDEYSKLDLREYEEIKMCITSGSLTNIEIARKLGGFNEKLFIDHVDHDFCLRLYRSGYNILRVNRAWILHEIGKIKSIYIFPGIGKLTGIKWFLRPKHPTNHPPVRIYYQTRNLLYMLRKYKKEYNERPFYCWNKFFLSICMRVVYEDQKIKKISAFLKGFFNGLFISTD